MNNNSIALVIPVMRNEQARVVLRDLKHQTVLPDVVFLVDNGGTWHLNDVAESNMISLNWHNKYNLKCYRPEENIGTNAAWNLLWLNYFDGFDYVGLIGDDYRVNSQCIETMKRTIDSGASPAVTCKIQNGGHYPTSAGNYAPVPVRGKGHMGFALFDRKFLLTLPPIPKEFFIFFGDNWIGYHIEMMDKQLLEVNSPISHKIRYDLSERLNYKKVIEKERIIWKSWIRGEIEL